MNEFMPTIRIELDGIKQAVTNMFIDHNNELNEAIKKQLEVCLTEEWVQQEIEAAVRQAARSAIRSLGDNYAFQQMLVSAMLDNIKTIVEARGDE